MPTIPANIQTRDLTSMAGRLSAAWDVLRGRPFGPGTPLTATDPQPSPRQFQYPFAVNNQIMPRREYPGLTPFEQLRNLAALYDVAAIAIATRIEELQGMRWAVVAKDKKQQHREQATCDEIAAFWNKPDQLTDWSAWISMLLYDLFTLDAPAVYRRPAQGGGLYGLEVIDGATIKPLLDDRGRTVAYQQILHGRPEGEWSTDELRYTPRWTRSFTPYGLPPTEWIILRINMAIRKQTSDMAYFTDGNIPAGFMIPPEGMQDPNQVQQFEEMFNADLQGEDRARARIKFLPWNGKYTPTKPFSYTTAIDEWMLKLTCAAFGVTPSELGFTNDVNRATAGMQENVTYRRGLGPLCMWLKRTHFDPVIQNDFGQRQLEMRPDFGESEDRERTAGSDKSYWDMGVVSSDELRTLRFGDELDGPAPGPPQPAAPQLPAPDADVKVIQSDLQKYSKKTEARRKAYDKMRQNSPKHQERRAARSAVRSAIDRGDLKPASERKCRRCGEQASQYHHRSYDKKDGLDVEPVCGGCNTRLSHKEPRRAFKKRDGPGPDWAERADHEQQAEQRIAAAFAAQLKRIVAVLKANPDRSMEQALATQWQAEPELLANDLLSLFDDVTLAGAQEGLRYLTTGADWSLVNEAALQLAQERVREFAVQSCDASKRQIALLTARWIAQGGTLDQLLERVARVYPGYRAEAEAITQVTQLYADANVAAWKATGYVWGYRWNTANDEIVRQCKFCWPRHKQTYPLDDPNGRPPGHHRCRCWVTPVLEAPTP